MYQKLYRWGYLTYGMLFVLAIVFYKERTIFIDIAYHLFYIIKDQRVAIQNFRFGAVATQIFPMMAARLSLPLETIMVVYSAVFVVYQVACYFITGTVLKQYKLALVLLLTNILFATDTFFWVQSELQQAMPFMIVVLAFMFRLRDASNPIVMAMIFLGIATTVFFHPLMIFLFIFAVGYLLLSPELGMNRRLLAASTIVFIFFFLLKKYVFVTQYDAGAMQGVKRLLTTFPHYFGLYSNKRFLLDCLTKYYWIPIAAGALIGYYGYRRSWYKLVIFGAFFFGYLLLVNVSYDTDYTPDYYLENLYLPLGMMLAIPVVFDLLPRLERRAGIAYGLFTLIALTAVLRIFLVSDVYMSRLDWARSVLKEYGYAKMLLDAREVPMEKALAFWATLMNSGCYLRWNRAELPPSSSMSLLRTKLEELTIPNDLSRPGSYLTTKTCLRDTSSLRIRPMAICG